MRLKVNIFLSDKNMKEAILSDEFMLFADDYGWIDLPVLLIADIPYDPLDLRQPYTIVPCRVTPEGEPVSDRDFMDMVQRAGEAGYLVAV